MPFDSTHVDAVTAAVTELTHAKAAHDAAKDKLKAALPNLEAGMKDGDIFVLGARVNAVQKVGGEVKYVVIPGITDPTP